VSLSRPALLSSAASRARRVHREVQVERDDGYGAGVLGPEIRFDAAGPHTIRIQVREDGMGIDQIVLSSARYLDTAPGALKNDMTILARAVH
jgi:hypothetical protein